MAYCSLMRSGFCLFLISVPAFAQGIITTVAGTQFVFPNTPLPATAAPLGSVASVALDSADNLYIADSANNLVFKVDAQGTLRIVAGNGIPGFSGDGGPAVQASLYSPQGVAVDRSGNLFIADSNNFRIRVVNPAGIISTFAGSGDYPSGTVTGDNGPGTAAAVRPGNLAFDPQGNLLVASDFAIRKISPPGIITTIAPGYFAYGIAADGGGGVLFTNGTHLYRFSTAGVTTVASNLHGAGGVVVDAAGNALVAEYGQTDTASNRILSITPAGVVTTIAGTGSVTYTGDGMAASLAAMGPVALAFDSVGRLLIADTYNERVRRIKSDGTIETIAGSGNFMFTGDGGSASGATLNGPQGIQFDSAGNLFIADAGNNRVRKIAPDGTITTVAGNGAKGYLGNGVPATSAALSAPNDMTVDTAGNLLIADSGNDLIRRVSPDGIISTAAGTGASGIISDAAGGYFFSDANSVRHVDATGKISTAVGGNVGCNNFNIGLPCSFTNGDGGPATAAVIGPAGLASDPRGDLFIADLGHGTVRKVAANGIITTITPPAQDLDFLIGPQFLAQQPRAVVADSAGNVYYSETVRGNVPAAHVQHIAPSGVISTIAGGAPGFSGDGGPALNAAFNNPTGLALDAAGNLFIADSGNNRIREVLAAKPPIQVSASSLAFSAQSTGAPAPAQTFNIASIPGLAFSLSVTTATGGAWLTATPQAGGLPRLIEVVADPSQLNQPGDYRGTITITAPDASPSTVTVGVTFTVGAAPAPSLSLDVPSFSFSFARSSPAQSQHLTVSNAGGGALPFTATAAIATPNGGTWLTLSAASGKATPAAPVILTLTADPTGLAAGTYTAAVTVVGGGDNAITVPVTMTISAFDQAILLSQRGLSFTAVAGGGIVPPQTFSVRNIGSGVVKWTAAPSTLPAGLSWLQVSPAGGASDAAAPAPVLTVTVNPAGLAPGAYYGLVTVSAPAPVVNSPQVLTVFLQVLPARTDVGAVVGPGSLIFTAAPGLQSPSSQTVSVYNITADPKSYRSSVAADPGLKLATLPTDATLDPQRPNPIVVQPFTDGLGPGVYNGSVTLLFSDGRLTRINVKVVVANGAGSSPQAREARARRRAAAPPECTPTKLVPTIVSLPDSFAVSAGWPVSIGARVSDDCGNPLQTGSVTVTFSNGDSSVVLQPQQDGRWEGTWPTRTASTASVTLHLHAESPQSQFTGDQQISGNLQTQQQPPVLDMGGVISVFGSPAFSSPAPGGLVAIYGQRLAGSALVSTDLPLQTQLVDTQVFVQGIRMRLFYVDGTQINGMIPYEVNPNAPQQLVVQRGNTLSLPSLLNVAPAQPALLGAPGAVTVHPSDGGSPHSLTADAPAHVGDTLTFSCVGLGAVSPAIADGSLPDPTTVVSVANPVQVQIGGVPAAVTFQGLGSQFPGIYQVTAVVPGGSPTGDAVPVVLSVAGQVSQSIAIAVR